MTLWSSIKEIKAPYVFNGENGIALHAMQGNQASSRFEGEVSWFFSFVAAGTCVHSRVMAGMAIQNSCCSATSGLLSSYEGHIRTLHDAGQCNMNASLCDTGDRGSLSSCHSDIGIPIHFQQESGIITL